MMQTSSEPPTVPVITASDEALTGDKRLAALYAPLRQETVRFQRLVQKLAEEGIL